MNITNVKVILDEIYVYDARGYQIEAFNLFMDSLKENSRYSFYFYDKNSIKFFLEKKKWCICYC